MLANRIKVQTGSPPPKLAECEVVSFALPLSWMLLLFVSACFLMKWQHEGVLLVPTYFLSMITFFWRKQDSMSLIKEEYFTCFGTKLWGRDKPWAPYTACHCCVPLLSQHGMVWLESRSLSHYHRGCHIPYRFFYSTIKTTSPCWDASY